MIIRIDGNEANIKNRVGVGRYAYELLWQFYKSQKSKIKSQNFNLKLKIYLKDKPLKDLPKETDWWKYKIVGPRKLWTQIALPLALAKDCLLKGRQISVFFTPSHYAPRFSLIPTVISIMDLSFLHYPRMFRRQDLWQLKNWTGYSVRKAAKILTISEATKNDIIKHYRVGEEKVVVTYPGINKSNMSNKQSFSANKSNLIKGKYGIDGDYILSVGTLQPRKNYVRLIEVFGKLCHPEQSEGSRDSSATPQNDNLELVIVGKKGWLYEEILAAPKKYGVEDKVKFLDYVSDENLPSLYQNAKCFVLVSLYEGFGLPVLEAMSYGCPVVVSNVSSLPEVAGEAGILVDPNNVEEISDKLLKLLRLPKEKREEMIKKGLEQAKKFSWEKCAQETLQVLEEIAHG